MRVRRQPLVEDVPIDGVPKSSGSHCTKRVYEQCSGMQGFSWFEGMLPALPFDSDSLMSAFGWRSEEQPSPAGQADYRSGSDWERIGVKRRQKIYNQWCGRGHHSNTVCRLQRLLKNKKYSNCDEPLTPRSAQVTYLADGCIRANWQLYA